MQGFRRNSLTEHCLLTIHITAGDIRLIKDTKLSRLFHLAGKTTCELDQAIPHLKHVVQVFSGQATSIALSEVLWSTEQDIADVERVVVRDCA